MIEVKALTKNFGKLRVLKGVNISFHKGEVVSVIGPNGSGKTTLIKSILGMVIPDSGEILLDGKSINGQWKYRSKIGYMPQIGRYPDNMKIGQVFSMMRDLRTDATAPDESVLNSYKLPSLFDKTMRTLSGGTRQKVSAALAFLFNPDILILDEPTAGLDPLASEILKQHILEAKSQGKCILITSHIMSEVDELADRIVYMMDGEVAFDKTIKQIKEETGEERLGRAIANLMKTEHHA
ncbi:MAG: ABC transporter ATP-binding protein [Bacteroidia bacterium]|nr:ABC transporter ATP-binding protein [Bacteroidia bacterium]